MVPLKPNAGDLTKAVAVGSTVSLLCLVIGLLVVVCKALHTRRSQAYSADIPHHHAPIPSRSGVTQAVGSVSRVNCPRCRVDSSRRNTREVAWGTRFQTALADC
ncbi:hypothetical protein C8Q76DRAFT_215280 [Earliella scabrosa]|nr:hypothetical protein C8Q76DRAFT_215280 [Earliella scabrosa]